MEVWRSVWACLGGLCEKMSRNYGRCRGSIVVHMENASQFSRWLTEYQPSVNHSVTKDMVRLYGFVEVEEVPCSCQFANYLTAYYAGNHFRVLLCKRYHSKSVSSISSPEQFSTVASPPPLHAWFRDLQSVPIRPTSPPHQPGSLRYHKEPFRRCAHCSRTTG